MRTASLEGGGLTGTVTGPPLPGVIRRGSFDAATGGIEFEVEVDGGAATFVFNGMVVAGTAVGRVRAPGGVEGNFRLTKSDAGKAAAESGPAVRQGRLSVLPVEQRLWKKLMGMAEG